MKISLLTHDPASHLPSTSGVPAQISRNLDPLQHPHARARERKRALNASKLERMFAQPFVAGFEGHADSVTCLERVPCVLSAVASASHDGDIIVHQIAQRTQVAKFSGAHKGKVSALCMADGPEAVGVGKKLLSCGHDKYIRMWQLPLASGSEDASASMNEPMMVYPGKAPFSAMDHHRTEPAFATGSNLVQLWDETKSVPVSNLTFGVSTETVDSLRFNASESSVLATAGSDRTLTIYDVRTGKAERRVIMQFRTNSLAWSPTFPTSILLASEDHNLYTFDIRSLATPTQIYKGHVSAVMSCAWSPTGTEFVSGGWDRTLRVWKEGEGRGGEVLHTKRMQRVLSCVYTSDARFVLSGSDDGNVRMWKAKPNDRLGVLDGRERSALEYREALKERWKFDKEISRVQRSRVMPKAVKDAAQLKRTMLSAQAVKEDRRRKHSRAGEGRPMAERRKVVLAEQS